MATYILTPKQTGTEAPKGARHVCGTPLTPTKTAGRYTCTKCLQSGYLIPA